MLFPESLYTRAGASAVGTYTYAHTLRECLHWPASTTGAVVSDNRWEHFPHDADVGIRGFGRSRAEAFEHAALAMTAAVTDLESVDPREAIEIHCAAPDDELLLADWLNALVYEMGTRRMLFSRFEVHIHEGRLEGRAWGERVDIEKHRPIVEVKGATYTSLRVGEEPGGTWIAQCVIDV